MSARLPNEDAWDRYDPPEIARPKYGRGLLILAASIAVLLISAWLLRDVR